RWRRARFAVLLQIPRPPLRGGRAAPERGAGTRILEGRAARSADAAAAGRGAGGTARSAVSGTRTRRSARSRGARAGAPDHPKITERGAGGVVFSSARGRSGPDGPEGGRRPGRRSRGPRPPLGGRRAGPPASGKGRRGGLVRTVGMLLPSAPDFVEQITCMELEAACPSGTLPPALRRPHSSSPPPWPSRPRRTPRPAATRPAWA